jgi:hypothetical protein
MQTSKTLWMLDYRQGKWSNLVPIYAVDEAVAPVLSHRKYGRSFWHHRYYVLRGSRTSYFYIPLV